MKRKPALPGNPGFKYSDDEEKALITEIEASDWQPLAGKEKESLRTALMEAARTTRTEIETKTERMNIRMSKRDMEALKKSAEREGLPYQSLVTSILHKFTEGRLVDIDEARKILRG